MAPTYGRARARNWASQRTRAGSTRAHVAAVAVAYKAAHFEKLVATVVHNRTLILGVYCRLVCFAMRLQMLRAALVAFIIVLPLLSAFSVSVKRRKKTQEARKWRRHAICAQNAPLAAEGHVARDAAIHTSSSNSSGGFTQSLQSFQNIEYRGACRDSGCFLPSGRSIGTVLVGNPPQMFEVIFDTGSDVFWLPQKGCRASGVDVEACQSGKAALGENEPKSSVNENAVKTDLVAVWAAFIASFLRCF